MTTGVWYGERLKFQSPRHVKVTPNQHTTETTVHINSVKGLRTTRVIGVCPSDTVNTFHFCHHTGVPRQYGLTDKGRSEEGISVVIP
jgi:hypothetical protein